MSDDGIDTAMKVGSGGLGVWLLRVFFERFFKREDQREAQVLARLDQLSAQLTRSNEQLAVVIDRLERADAALEDTRRQLTAVAERVARLEATVEQLSEGVIR